MLYLFGYSNSYTVQAIIKSPMKVLKAIHIIQSTGFHSANGNCLYEQRE